MIWAKWDKIVRWLKANNVGIYQISQPIKNKYNHLFLFTRGRIDIPLDPSFRGADFQKQKYYHYGCIKLTETTKILFIKDSLR